MKDPRVSHEANEDYIDLVEKYFEKTGEDYYAGGELADSRPSLNFQVGITPELVEKARDHEELVKSLPSDSKPLSRFPPEFDAKWRFFWPIGERPQSIRNDLPKVIPENFPTWEEKMDSWGNNMIGACETAA